jgi:hypothetical protein
MSAGGNILGDIGKFVDFEIGKICIYFGKIQDNFAWGKTDDIRPQIAPKKSLHIKTKI